MLVFSVITVLSCTAPRKNLPDRPLVIVAADSLTGYQQMQEQDCLTCHSINEKILGPSFQMVANRYTSNDSMLRKLSAKIRNGGLGSWGEVPMTPHRNLSQKDTETIIKYIFSLKNNTE